MRRQAAHPLLRITVPANQLSVGEEYHVWPSAARHVLRGATLRLKMAWPSATCLRSPPRVLFLLFSHLSYRQQRLGSRDVNMLSGKTTVSVFSRTNVSTTDSCPEACIHAKACSLSCSSSCSLSHPCKRHHTLHCQKKGGTGLYHRSVLSGELYFPGITFLVLLATSPGSLADDATPLPMTAAVDSLLVPPTCDFARLASSPKLPPSPSEKDPVRYIRRVKRAEKNNSQKQSSNCEH